MTLLAAIEAWPLSAFIRQSLWAYPALEVVHIASFAVMVGALVLLELRILGRAPALPLAPLGALAVRVAVVAFTCAALAGLLMLAARPTELIANPAFQAKLVLLTLAGGNAWLFHRRRGLQRTDGAARLQAVLSLGLWLAVICAGRLIAYV